MRVVIVGQDPYHGLGQAHGLSFSVRPGVAIPLYPSKISHKELLRTLGLNLRHGCLVAWAHKEPPLLLLNATLTVRGRQEPLAHHKKGWEEFTDAIIEAIAQQRQHVVFLLWGKNAQEKCQKFSLHASHLVLTAAHPSPFSAHNGFLGCHHFSKAIMRLPSVLRPSSNQLGVRVKCAFTKFIPSVIGMLSKKFFMRSARAST